MSTLCKKVPLTTLVTIMVIIDVLDPDMPREKDEGFAKPYTVRPLQNHQEPRV